MRLTSHFASYFLIAGNDAELCANRFKRDWSGDQQGDALVHARRDHGASAFWRAHKGRFETIRASRRNCGVCVMFTFILVYAWACVIGSVVAVIYDRR